MGPKNLSQLYLYFSLIANQKILDILKSICEIENDKR